VKLYHFCVLSCTSEKSFCANQKYRAKGDVLDFCRREEPTPLKGLKQALPEDGVIPHKADEEK
jgi:hypothetical protein